MVAPLPPASTVYGQEWLDLLPSSIGDLSTPDHSDASRGCLPLRDNTGTASRQTRPSASPEKWVVNGYPLHYKSTNLRASFDRCRARELAGGLALGGCLYPSLGAA